MEPTKQQERKEASKREKLYLLLVFVLLIGNGVLVWQLINRGIEVDQKGMQVTGLELLSDSLHYELEDLGNNFDSLQTDNVELMSQINEQKTRIEEYKLELEAAEGDRKKMRRIIAKLKKETGTLREIMKGYVHTIDSLNQMNMALTAELGQTKGQLTQVTSERDVLQGERDNLSETVRVGSILQTFSVKANAIRLRSGGSQVETNRAKRAEMIKTCFGIRENKIAKAGKRDLYVRLIAPDGTVLENGDKLMMDISGGAGTAQYSVKRTVDYNNAEMEVCVYFELAGAIAEGNYLAEVYSDKEVIGTASFILK